ncbi:MAG TPA: DLW-39 family protein [Mycobacteriales bacterium]|nr:DLW-39 family protein [Mycobacteriales bacterium]
MKKAVLVVLAVLAGLSAVRRWRGDRAEADLWHEVTTGGH